ncbi:MAG: NYN domain-containing protein [Simkaniaceae bacterium]|nr:NYN domain-containing protein [Candidatus Sacchlamyda saccharinae]
MFYLIDGYNFLFRLESTKEKSLEKRRESLICILNEQLASFKGGAAVVFDSAEQIREFAQCAALDHLEVLYAPKGLTADNYIIELAEQSKSPRTITVVTSDSGLARQCQHIGTNTLSIEEFITLLSRRNQEKPQGKPRCCDSNAEIERLRKIFEDRL